MNNGEGLYNKAKSKLFSLFEKDEEKQPEEHTRDDSSYFLSDTRKRIESWFVHQTSVVKDLSELKFDEITRKYNHSDTVQRYIEIHKEIEKEFEDKKPKTLFQKTKEKVSSGADKVKSVFKRKPKQKKSSK